MCDEKLKQVIPSAKQWFLLSTLKENAINGSRIEMSGDYF
jgi:hypothetical protein